jgi:hypothetical protein
MTQEEFARIVSEDPVLSKAFRNVAAASRADRERSGTFTEVAIIVVLFPVAVHVVRNIGLPWLYEANRYTELWRKEFHTWVDKKYREHGFDPESVEKAGYALRRELEETVDTHARKAWERLAELLRKEKSDKENGT